MPVQLTLVMTMGPVPCEKRAFFIAAAPIYNEIKNIWFLKVRRYVQYFKIIL